MVSCPLLLSSLALASAAAAASTSQPIVLKGGFWYGKFAVGAAADATLLIDTGSTHLALNPGLYQPGPDSALLTAPFNTSYGTTNSDGSGVLELGGKNYDDTVRLGPVSVAGQQVGVLDDKSDSGGSGRFPEDGIIGFGGFCVADDCPDAWMEKTCADGAVDECRFGLALGTDGTGQLVVGTLDHSLFDGDLTTSGVVAMWYVHGDVSTGAGVVVEEGAPMLLDSGSSTIIGSVAAVTKIFEDANVSHFTEEADGRSSVHGYFPCDAPPTLRFAFPSAKNSTAAGQARSFAVSGSAMILARGSGNNNCTSVLSGLDMAVPQLGGANLWVVGQPFFQGHYVDFDIRDPANPLVGFAELKSSTGLTSAGGSGSDSITGAGNVSGAMGVGASGAMLGLAAAAALALVL